MKKFICLCILIIFVTCVGCGNPKKYNITLGDVLRAANENRKVSNKSQDIQKYLYKYNDKDQGFTDDEVDMLTNFDLNSAYKNYNENKVITKEMALSDINYLFKLLKYTYGGYEYFGGDKVFNAAKATIIERINSMNKLTAGEIQNLICGSLYFIKDGHFLINNYAPIDNCAEVYFYNENYEFYKDEDGYYTLIDNKKYYLKSVENSDQIMNYMKLTVNSKGDLVYNIGLLQNKYAVQSKLNIKLINGKKKLDKEILLKESKKMKRNNAEGFSKEIKSGVPIVTCTRMSNIDDNTCKLFGQTGKELKSYPISIIDIRGNGGGYDTSSLEWFKGYTGKEANPAESYALLYSKVFITSAMKTAKNMIRNKENMTQDSYNKVLDGYNKLTQMERSKDFNKWEVEIEAGSFVDNKNIVFVLIDNGVASSGEGFIRNLRTLRNVIFVGTNTNGCGSFGNCYYYRLPNTGMVLYFGADIDLTSDFEEGVGYMPDIWINSGDSLERIEKLIEKNK